ncbi:MAG: MBL fold metallo-hydrolase [Prevotella sp.]|nr:MBL fold metallo-hydrolase [Prevotella sp.]
MQLTFLGTGTSGGVPSLGCHCEVCTSTDPRDKRYRSAVFIENEGTRLLIDAGPDIRMQLMPLDFKPLDGVLLTHIHYDHVAGIDDLRGFCVFGDINIYADEATVKALKITMPYCFTEKLYPGVPLLNLHTIQPLQPLTIGSLEILPLQVMHGRMPIMAYRIGKLAYITDMKTIDPSQEEALQDIDTLVVNALRWEREHHSHMLVPDAIEFARRIGAKRTFLTHLTHKIGLHDEANARLPEGFQFAYDGLKIEI